MDWYFLNIIFIISLILACYKLKSFHVKKRDSREIVKYEKLILSKIRKKQNYD